MIAQITCHLHPTKHAKDRMIERGIERSELVQCLTAGRKQLQGGKIVARLKGLEAVFVQKPCNSYIITVYRR